MNIQQTLFKPAKKRSVESIIEGVMLCGDWVNPCELARYVSIQRGISTMDGTVTRKIRLLRKRYNVIKKRKSNYYLYRIKEM